MNHWSVLRLVRMLPGPKPHNPYFDAAKPHHTPIGFRNNHPRVPPTQEELARLHRDLGAKAPASAPQVDLSPAAPDLALLQANRTRHTVTWIGHSTVLVQTGGRNLITDPMFSQRASPLPFTGPRRHQPPGIALRDLPPIDLVLISHNHYDHLDLPSVRALSRQRGGSPSFAVPLGLERWFRRRLPHANVVALDWWESRVVAGVTVTLVPVHHWSARTPWDGNSTLWGGWVAERAGFRFFFSGDTAYSQDFPEIGRRLGPFDLAAIAIGHYEPRWFMRNNHINPEEAVRIHGEIGARRSLGIHWGTFEHLTQEPLDQPLRDLAAARLARGVAEEEFFVLRHGQTRVIE